MKYSVSSSFKNTAINRNRKSLAIFYGGGIVIALVMLWKNYENLPQQSTIFFLGIIIISPVAFWFFDRNFRSKLNTGYEITEEDLLIFENDVLKSTIKLNSIQSVKRIPLGYKVTYSGGNFYIVDSIDKIEELINRITK